MDFIHIGAILERAFFLSGIITMISLFMFLISFCDLVMFFVPYRLGMGPGGVDFFGVTQCSICGTVLFKLGVFYIQDLRLSLSAHQHLNFFVFLFACMIFSN